MRSECLPHQVLRDNALTETEIAARYDLVLRLMITDCPPGEVDLVLRLMITDGPPDEVRSRASDTVLHLKTAAEGASDDH